MRKLMVALFVVMLCSCSASAYDINIGIITKAGISEEDFSSSVANVWRWAVVEDYHGEGRDRFMYYDSLNSLLMAIRRGDIDEIQCPRPVAEYFLSANSGEYTFSCVFVAPEAECTFGFLKGEKGAALRDRFNGAIRVLKGNNKLSELQRKYITNPKYDAIEPVNFEKFDGAETIRVAVTGDLPPIDFVDAEGNAAGFNTALLAEIGRELKVNIELVDIDAIARTPALTSGRADAVFWYQVISDTEVQYDVPEEVIVSDSYFDWDTFVHIRKVK